MAKSWFFSLKDHFVNKAMLLKSHSISRIGSQLLTLHTKVCQDQRLSYRLDLSHIHLSDQHWVGRSLRSLVQDSAKYQLGLPIVLPWWHYMLHGSQGNHHLHRRTKELLANGCLLGSRQVQWESLWKMCHFNLIRRLPESRFLPIAILGHIGETHTVF